MQIVRETRSRIASHCPSASEREAVPLGLAVISKSDDGESESAAHSRLSKRISPTDFDIPEFSA
jgi:hypothetical protein